MLSGEHAELLGVPAAVAVMPKPIQAPRDRGWVIEGDGPVWWNGGGFTDDDEQAIRYARKRDAEAQIKCWRPEGSADNYLRAARVA